MGQLDRLACACCGEPLPVQKGPGRRRRYCNATCRSRARRQRDARERMGELGSGSSSAAAMALLEQEQSTIRRRTVEAITAQMDGEPAGPPEEQLAQAILELAQLVGVLQSAASRVAPQLAGRAEALAAVIAEGIGRHFGEVVDVG